MLYPYQAAEERAAPAGAQELFRQQPGELTAAFLHLLGETFSDLPAGPAVFCPGEGSALMLLYREVAFAWEDLCGSYGEAMAAISRRWPLTILGTVRGRETGEVTVRREGDRIVTRTRCVSGRPFEVMNSLCVRLETGSPREAAHLAALAEAIGFRRDCAVLGVEHREFLRQENLLEPLEGALFCYVPLEPCLTSLGCLEGLPAQRKEKLWRVFLEDGVQPLEFQWLWEASQRGEAPHLLEWELTLRSVLDSLGFSVVNTGEGFQVRDREGKERYFDLIRGGGGEKMFLKILFPVVR